MCSVSNGWDKKINLDLLVFILSVEGGELFDRVVDENYILTEMAVAMIVYQICEAIRYIHSQNIIHLDLKVLFWKIKYKF